jgi:hypothetical protein
VSDPVTPDDVEEETNVVEAALDAFAEAVKVLDPKLAGLEEAGTVEKLDAAETELDIKLPPSYRSFLLRWNGGNAHETSIYGVASSDSYDLVVLNKRGREEGLPKHLVGFAATITGDVYCFNTSQGDDADEFPISLIDVEEGQVIPACDSFLEWLERLPNLEQELAEARGPQPMTVEEWEAFVERERVKLRRLSKTPARDLTMPDPELVRADLNGKIPVDPRHLKPRT